MEECVFQEAPVGKKGNIPSILVDSWLRNNTCPHTPVLEERLTRDKQTSLITCVPPVYTVE